MDSCAQSQKSTRDAAKFELLFSIIHRAKRGDCYADIEDKTSEISVPQARQLLASIIAQTPVALDGSSDLALLVDTASRTNAPLSAASKAMTQTKGKFVMRTCRLQCE